MVLPDSSAKCAAEYVKGAAECAAKGASNAPPNAPPTIYRDQRVFKHMGTLTRSGKW